MIRLAISVEGSTEEQFVKSVLTDHLLQWCVMPTPILLGRARSSGTGGGNVSIERLGRDMAECYHNFGFVTSLVDFYGFRDRDGRTAEELEQEILQEVGRKIHGDLDKRKVVPYIQMHEFEGLLFSDVGAFGNILELRDQAREQLAEVRTQFQTPEDINDNPDAAPSKRIAEILPHYEKVKDGLRVAERIGLTTIRAQCPRFNQWVTQLESLGATAQ